jgi:hypothetical protein
LFDILSGKDTENIPKYLSLLYYDRVEFLCVPFELASCPDMGRRMAYVMEISP